MTDPNRSYDDVRKYLQWDCSILFNIFGLGPSLARLMVFSLRDIMSFKQWFCGDFVSILLCL